MNGTLQPMVGGRKWLLTTEGVAFQPEGLWPEGWNATPEVVNATYAQQTMGCSDIHVFILINQFNK